MSFEDTYGPWALVVGASDGIGSAFAEELAERGLNVVLLSRRGQVLAALAERIESRFGVTTRVVTADLADESAADAVIEATADLDIGTLVYCAGADPEFKPFLAQPVGAAEAMVRRNCLTLMRLCHHYAGPMVSRGRGAVVVLGSGAGLAGGPNMVAYSATKAFDMVFAEALWTELHGKGVDVLGLILGKTDTPALRRLEHARGNLASLDERPKDTATVDDVIAEAFANLTNGPTWIVGQDMRAAAQMMGSVSRSDAVRFIMQASAAAMGDG